MQTLDVISVNLWQILVSVCNLLLLLWVVKKFLYGPVKEILRKRQGTLDDMYDQAREAKEQALSCQREYEDKLSGADDEARLLIQNAVDTAKAREDEMLVQAKEKADGILRQARAEAALEQKKARSEIRREIVDVSAMLAEKILEREIRLEDHENLIDSVLKEMGEDDGGH